MVLTEKQAQMCDEDLADVIQMLRNIEEYIDDESKDNGEACLRIREAIGSLEQARKSVESEE